MSDDTQNSVNNNSAVNSAFPADIPVAPPSDFFPPASPTSTKPQVNGKIVATFLGLLLLVGAIGAGVVLVEQPQLLSQKAADPNYSCGSTSLSCAGNPVTGYTSTCLNSSGPIYCCASGSTIVNGVCTVDQSCTGQGMTRCETNSSGTKTGNVQVCANSTWHTASCGGPGYGCNNGECAPITVPGTTGGCFLAGTMVNTTNGVKAIETMSTSDKVLSFNNNNVNISNITNVYQVTKDNYLHIVAGTKTVDVTPEHRFYIGNGQFTEAQNLKLGDTVYLLENNSMVPSQVYMNQRIYKNITAYNLTVDNDHTFFANTFAVHNDSSSGVRCSLADYFSSADTVCGNLYGGGRAVATNVSCNSDEFNLGDINYWSHPSGISYFNAACSVAKCCGNIIGFAAAASKKCENTAVTVVSGVASGTFNGAAIVAGTNHYPVTGYTCKTGAAKDCAKSSIGISSSGTLDAYSVTSADCKMGLQDGYCCP